MLTTLTIDKLRALSLTGMAGALEEQRERADYHSLGFEERLGLLVDREMTERDNRRLARNLKAAKLRSDAALEDLDFHQPRGLDRGAILSLAEAAWVDAHQNILVVGPTGVGKTFLACALAQAAVRRGHTALYLRASRMLDELAVARVDGRLPRLLAAWARIEVLLIDDLVLQPLRNEQAAELLEVIEDRAGRRPTIVTSQLPISQWHESLGEATIAEAVLDRLLQNAQRIELRGDSLRRPQPAAERAIQEPARVGSAAAESKKEDHAEKRDARKAAAAR